MGDALKLKADVVIAGGGMVGLTLGIALADAGVSRRSSSMRRTLNTSFRPVLTGV
jgi:glycine/D-amino acid oxidase-like deaminating enzyme